MQYFFSDCVLILAITFFDRSERDSCAIHIYDGHSGGEEIHCLGKMHMVPCTFIAVSQYCLVYDDN